MRSNMGMQSVDKGNSLVGSQTTEQRIKRLEERFEELQNSLDQTFLKGRLRSDYTSAPADSNDINPTNRLFDVVILTNSQYIVVNDGGNLKWRQITLSSF